MIKSRFTVIAGLLIICISAALLKGRLPFFKSIAERAGLISPTPEGYKISLVKYFSFSEEGALKEWKEKILKGKVLYRIERDPKTAYVHATSYQTASALFYKIQLDVKEREPVIAWKWYVEQFPEKEGSESIEKMSDDDFAARIYVIFPAKFFTHTKVVEYIWAEKLPEGATGISPYSENIRLMVLKSGAAKEKKFYFEKRNIIEDYVALYGERPRRNIGAIAFMTDADTTKTTANAMYTDIKLGYKNRVLVTRGGDTQ